MSRIFLFACVLSTLLSLQSLPLQSARADEAAPIPIPAPMADETTTRTIAPGVELTTIHRNTPGAPLQIFITKVDPKAGTKNLKWKLKLATGGDTVFDFAPVSQMAKRDNAVVAINGGYFAFGGAALGAVKIDGEWIRLPLKNRTAVGFDEQGGVLIDNLRFGNKAMFGDISRLGYLWRETTSIASVANLNGFANDDSATILTSRFGAKYVLRADENAMVVTGGINETGKVTGLSQTGSIYIPHNQWVLVTRGHAKEDFEKVVAGQEAKFLYEVRPDEWQKYPTILGAGPRLLKNGEIFTTEKEEEFRPDVLARGPRSAFGVDAQGNWIFLVCDGREKEYSAGLSIAELAQEMKNAGAVEALCLDGGGSSTLVVNNEVINRPSDGAERKVPDAILVVPVEEKTQ